MRRAVSRVKGQYLSISFSRSPSLSLFILHLSSLGKRVRAGDKQRSAITSVLKSAQILKLSAGGQPAMKNYSRTHTHAHISLIIYIHICIYIRRQRQRAQFNASKHLSSNALQMTNHLWLSAQLSD